jgi:hypothetical protein
VPAGRAAPAEAPRSRGRFRCQGKESRFETIAEGVYLASGSSGGSSPVIVGDREALMQFPAWWFQSTQRSSDASKPFGTRMEIRENRHHYGNRQVKFSASSVLPAPV